LWVIFALLDPDPDPQPWYHVTFVRLDFIFGNDNVISLCRNGEGRILVDISIEEARNLPLIKTKAGQQERIFCSSFVVY
jgi:hypothetical protein